MPDLFTNPQTFKLITNYPYGRLRTAVIYMVEKNPRGERVVRITINPKNGTVNKPKYTTYYTKVTIVEDNTGKIVILGKSKDWNSIHGIKRDMKHTIGYWSPDTNHKEYGELAELIITREENTPDSLDINQLLTDSLAAITASFEPA